MDRLIKLSFFSRFTPQLIYLLTHTPVMLKVNTFPKSGYATFAPTVHTST